MAYISTKLHRAFRIEEIITIHYFEYARNFVFRGEAHDFWEFLYVDSGSVEIGADEKSYILKAGDLIFHQPFEFHSIKATKDTAPNLVVISFLCNSPAMERLKKAHFSVGDAEKVILSKIIAEARAAFSTPLNVPSVEQVRRSPHAEFGAESLLCCYLEELFVHLCRRQESKAVQPPMLQSAIILPPTISSAKEREQLSRILEYLKVHIEERLSVPQMSSAVLISRSSIEQLFHKYMQCGVMQHFNKMKIDLAKQMIREGKNNFSQIAEYLSFSNASYFTQCFHRETGMTPMEYAQSVNSLSKSVAHIRSSPPQEENTATSAPE